MSDWFKRRTAIVGVAAVWSILAVNVTSAYETRHVIVVLIDGVRYTESLGDSSGTYCPRLTALATSGVVHDAAFNDSVTVTRVAIPSVWMGRWDTLVNLRCPWPTFWEYVRKDLQLPAEKAIYVTPNYGDNLWRPSEHSQYGRAYWPQFILPPSSDDNNAAVFDSAVVAIRRQKPRLAYVYFPDTDHAGHSGNWSYYVSKIRQADSLAAALWNVVQTDSVMAGRTAFIVTNDHGRHDDAHGGFQGHGDGCPGCRHVMLLAIGPDFRVNTRLSGPPASIIDIAVTAGELLGYDPVYSQGRVLYELFLPGFCSYTPGDINGDGLVAGSDVTYGVRYFKGLGQPPRDSCFDDSTGTYIYSAGDVNGNCEFRGSDITLLVAYLKQAYPPLNFCRRTPPR